MLEVARERGLRVAWRDLGRRNGEYHSTGLILLNPKRTITVQRVTLAHEIGHAEYGHARVNDPVLHARQERLADEFAADLLIDSGDYIAAESVFGSHVGTLARELGVTSGVVEAWRRRTSKLIAAAS
ncbi:MAG: ImmA/IrrE family metallo-endopeptidase [Cellulomonas sp.]|uniref:ImmA/IrrE family metallo-endopeptidase n=1 Tax=Cellulomonas sp. TaxID=40001 RepID=UPI002587717D|nr:ImmA/IrrE family metallo-endopeptidase [Cellulomonas sp.]MCR6706528.1 ImmA/IrrE family metallo-endopeptidase [Cellulomonas sp.]